MYWSDWGSDAKIERASMDGQNRTVIHDTDLMWPNALTLDFQTQILYWADANLDKIESSNTDGSNRRLLTTTSVSHPFDITVFEERLYWSDWTEGIIAASISNPELENNVIVERFCTDSFGIQIVSEQRQQQGNKLNSICILHVGNKV